MHAIFCFNLKQYSLMNYNEAYELKLLKLLHFIDVKN